MRINLITFHCALNYGAVLQTYALGRVLTRLGHAVTLADLRPPALTEGRTLHPLGLYKRWAFGHFIRTWCPPLAGRTDAPGAIRHRAPPAEAWVTGSDQVWNPEITGAYAGDYFLADLPPGVRRVAYAASFGRDVLTWDPAVRAQARGWLAGFDGLSVREASGVQLCAELGAARAEAVLDPTLLLGDFHPLLPETPCPGRDLLCMVYQPGPGFPAAAVALGRQLDLSPLVLGRRAPGPGLRGLAHPTVPRWVRAFRDAGFVLTDSFHGLAFALIFQRPFAVVPGNPERFCRLSELLQALQLESRIFASYEDLAASTRWREPVPYAEVQRRLADRRETSMAFLRRHLRAARPGLEGVAPS